MNLTNNLILLYFHLFYSKGSGFSFSQNNRNNYDFDEEEAIDHRASGGN